MSLVSDLLSLADRLVQIVNKRDVSDRAVFQDAIDPLFTELSVVVQDLLSMYRPITRMLANVDTSVNDTDVRGQYDTIVDTFRKQRAESRAARVRTDAAACALIEHFEDRDDEFAKRVTQLASRVRIIVGRAHTDPLDDQFPSSEEDCAETGGCTVSMEVARFLDDWHEEFTIDPDPSHPSVETTRSREFAASVVSKASATEESLLESRLTSYSPRAEEDYYRLRSAVSGITKRINSAWEDAAYIYSMVRLSVLSGDD